jgi:hypothetical protein
VRERDRNLFLTGTEYRKNASKSCPGCEFSVNNPFVRKREKPEAYGEKFGEK